MNESVPEWLGRPHPLLVGKLRRLADDLADINHCADADAPSAAFNSWTLGKRVVPCLIGRPLGHPLISDGRPAFSSELFYFDPNRGIARTLSRWYRLGTRVEPGYWGERLRRASYPLEDTI
ncbi:hypothetical protein [Rhizobium indicum]|uniref:Uncharacterized protein n=1 Tax=Rhizobium indicum TaxID=2583231 RepID=A0ABX6PJN7_9HYPH|nr:hypothetical protein [Rhizobium indicum]QKK18886.1 hypothetical protein FFM53_021585 [Rhizobium indicum]